MYIAFNENGLDLIQFDYFSDLSISEIADSLGISLNETSICLKKKFLEISESEENRIWIMVRNAHTAFIGKLIMFYLI